MENNYLESLIIAHKFEKNVLKTNSRLETSHLSSVVKLHKKHFSLPLKYVAQQSNFQHFFIGLVNLSLASSILTNSVEKDSVQSA